VSPAPDFSPGYPSGGEIISVAWQTAWDELAEAMVPRPELQALMAERSGCSPKTANNLVSLALRHNRVVLAEREAGVSMLCRRDVLLASYPDHPALWPEPTAEVS
jgi:hypothetical protein